MQLKRWIARLSLAAALLPNPALPQGQGAPVVVAQATAGKITQLVRLTGTVTALRRADLSVQTPGLVTALTVDAGAQVDAGQTLLELDSELAAHQYRGAVAAETRASLALGDARRRLTEARRLAPQQSIAETVVKDIAAEVAQDEAALAQATAELGYRREVLSRHRLSAPFPGVISQRRAELGEWVTPGQPVFTLVSTEQLRLDFQVPEDFLGQVGPDTRVVFSLGSDRSREYRGRVAATVPVTDPSARTFLTRVVPVKAISGLLPGMSVRADLRLDAGREGITVPRDAILRYADGRTVVWVAEQSAEAATAAERRVETGLSFDGRVEVLRGVSAGEQVVVQGNEALRNGQRLEIRSGEGA